MITDINNPECDVVEVLRAFIKSSGSQDMIPINIELEYSSKQWHTIERIYSVYSVMPFLASHTNLADNENPIKQQAIKLIMAWKSLNLVDFEEKEDQLFNNEHYPFMISRSFKL